jgi:type I restriction enzyme, S subunit
VTSAAGKPWPTKRLKYVVSLRRTRNNRDNSARRYIGLENIEAGTGRLIASGDAGESDHSNSNGVDCLSSEFELGDVLFGKLRPYLAKAWVANFAGRCTTELLVMQPLEVEANFLRYVCLSRDFVDAVDASTFGSKMPRADWEFIGNMAVPIPSRHQQRKIADFLDAETCRLDSLIAAKQNVLGLLNERQQSLVTRIVTRGCNSDEPLRDSGITWLGQIPRSWKTRRIAWLFHERDERGEPDLPLLEVSINSGVILREFSDDRIESVAADFNTYKVARKGDIAFNKMRMWQGAVGVVPQDGLVSPDYVVAAPVGDMSSDYAGVLFRTSVFSAECARRSHGIVWDRLRLYWEGFREIEVPLPDQEIQSTIVSYIVRELSTLNELRVAAERSVGLLMERRAALISDAVTGRISVT